MPPLHRLYVADLRQRAQWRETGGAQRLSVYNGWTVPTPGCEDCQIRNLCSGGCYHESYARYGDPTHPTYHYCELMRDWVDFGIEVYTRIMANNPAFISSYITRARLVLDMKHLKAINNKALKLDQAAADKPLKKWWR